MNTKNKIIEKINKKKLNNYNINNNNQTKQSQFEKFY